MTEHVYIAGVRQKTLAEIAAASEKRALDRRRWCNLSPTGAAVEAALSFPEPDPMAKYYAENYQP